MRAWAWDGPDRRNDTPSRPATRRRRGQPRPRRSAWPRCSGARRHVAECSVAARNGAAILVFNFGGAVGDGASATDAATGGGQHVADLCLTQKLDRERERDRGHQLVRPLRETDRGAGGGVDQGGERAAVRYVEPVQVLALDGELHLAIVGIALGEEIAQKLGIAAGRPLPIDVVHARFTLNAFDCVGRSLLQWSRFLRRTGIHFGGKRMLQWSRFLRRTGIHFGGKRSAQAS